MTVDRGWKEEWNRRKARNTTTRGRGQVTVTCQYSRILLSVPFNDDFRLGARALKGRYRYRTRRWSFSRFISPQVAALVARVYGPTGLANWPAHLPRTAQEKEGS